MKGSLNGRKMRFASLCPRMDQRPTPLWRGATIFTSRSHARGRLARIMVRKLLGLEKAIDLTTRCAMIVAGLFAMERTAAAIR